MGEPHDDGRDRDAGEGATGPNDACPFLGLTDDDRAHFGFPSSEHRCHSEPKRVYVELAHQGTYCLTARHVKCFRYYAPDAVNATLPPLQPQTPRPTASLPPRGGFGQLVETPKGWVPVATSPTESAVPGTGGAGLPPGTAEPPAGSDPWSSRPVVEPPREPDDAEAEAADSAPDDVPAPVLPAWAFGAAAGAAGADGAPGTDGSPAADGAGRVPDEPAWPESDADAFREAPSVDSALWAYAERQAADEAGLQPDAAGDQTTVAQGAPTASETPPEDAQSGPAPAESPDAEPAGTADDAATDHAIAAGAAMVAAADGTAGIATSGPASLGPVGEVDTEGIGALVGGPAGGEPEHGAADGAPAGTAEPDAGAGAERGAEEPWMLVPAAAGVAAIPSAATVEEGGPAGEEGGPAAEAGAPERAAGAGGAAPAAGAGGGGATGRPGDEPPVSRGSQARALGGHFARLVLVAVAGIAVLAALVGLGYVAGKMLVRPGEPATTARSTPAPAQSSAGPGVTLAPDASTQPGTVEPGASAPPPATAGAGEAGATSGPAATPKPSARPKPTAKPAPKATPGPRVYRVRSGDTLFGIAGRYGVTVNVIIDANDLKPPFTLYVGQKLVIPRQ